MKKFTNLLIVLAFVFCLLFIFTGCTDKENNEKTSDLNNSSDSSDIMNQESEISLKPFEEDQVSIDISAELEKIKKELETLKE